MNITKKIAAAIAVAFVTVPSMFAAVELRGSLAAVPYNSVKIGDANSFYELVPFGPECAATFYFGKIRPFNVGLNIGLGGEIFRWTYSDSKAHEIDGGFNAHFVIGPALRFDIPGAKSSFYVSPGFIFNFMGISDECNDEERTSNFLFALEYGFHVDVGYNYWVVRNEKFGLGLNFGADYSLGFGRAGSYKDVEWDKIEDDGFPINWSDLKSAQHLKIYTGVTFRFGQ